MKRLRTLLIRYAIRGTLAIPDGVVRRLLRNTAETYRGQTLHPRLQLGLSVLGWLGGRQLYDLTPEQARNQSDGYFDLLDIPKVHLASVTDRTLPGPAGDIPVRVYTPKRRTNPAPVLLYFHGGGFVIGDLDGYDHPCRKLAKVGQCVVISVGYRLAPEHKFPAGFEDCWAVFDWVRTHGDQWGLDTERIAVCGDSAGGNIAASIAQRARDLGGQQPNLQVLIYPGVDTVNTTASREELKHRGFLLSDELMSWYRNHTIKCPEDMHDVRVSPLLHGNFSGLAPAIVVTCGFDPLWDEGTAYADKMEAAGVAVERIHMPDMIHAVWSAGGVLRGVRKLQKHIGKQVRAAHQGTLTMSSELLAIAS